VIDYRQPENGLRLAKRIAHSCATRSMREFQADILEGVATDALMEALRKDTGTGNFAAFLTLKVKSRIIDYKRQVGPKTRHGYLKATNDGRRASVAGWLAWWDSRTKEQKDLIVNRARAGRKKGNNEARNRNSGAASRATAA